MIVPQMFRHRPRVARAMTLLLLAGLAGLSSHPASAQGMNLDTSWENGCAMRNVTPGPGDLLRTMNCSRQKDCMEMANARGAMMMEMGCIGVSPSAPRQPSGAVRSQPNRQQ